MKNKILSTLLIVLLTSNFLMAQHVYHSYDRPKTSKHLTDQSGKVESKGDNFELGFHYGPAWTSGDTKDFARRGSTFSMNLGANNGRVYFGTEFSITSWKDYQEIPEAKELNFNETNFLWLVQTKLFLGEGNVQPYIGCGTDLISFGEAILTAEDEEEDGYYSSYYEEEKNYNTWFVPSFGLRWKMGKDLSGNVGLSADLSRNYSYTRLQVGIVF
ncbi:hypothetical protein [Marinifilum fragile]|uniref:hypothetical protein n=1 Tax=Marinifilum fragile TaxID=570161 RepID=UPI002AA863A5|nr:hypothetical protein [Marinifilum fragile]